MRLNKLKAALLATRPGASSDMSFWAAHPLRRRRCDLAPAQSNRQLAGHIPTGRASDVVMTGADIMGAIVLLMAIIAILFLVATFIRRRGTVHVTSVPATSS